MMLEKMSPPRATGQANEWFEQQTKQVDAGKLVNTRVKKRETEGEPVKTELRVTKVGTNEK